MPDKGVSSYDKICKSLKYTQDFVDFTARTLHMLNTARVDSWKFGASEHATKVLVVNTTLNVAFGESPEEVIHEVWVGDSSNPGNWSVDVMTLCPDSRLNSLVDKLFGKSKSCPTYFCNPDKVKEKWPSYARDCIREDLKDPLGRTSGKLRNLMSEALNSEEFLREKTNFFERRIVDDIKQVLLKYAPIARPHVYKQAVDEYLITDIMESVCNVTGSDIESFYAGELIEPVGKAGTRELDHLLSHAY